MADAGSTATKTKTSARKTGAAGRSSGGSRAKTSGSRTTGTKTSARKTTARTARARTSGAAASKKPGTKAGTTATVQRPAARAGANGNGVKVPVPVLTPHLRTVRVPMPGLTYVEDAGRVVAGYLPPPERMAFYGGLGIAAVVGVIDWPVAAAIGVGTMLARRGMRMRPRASRA